MVRCVIEIKEVPGKGYSVDIVANQATATEKELFVASCFEHAIRTASEFVMQKARAAEMIHGTDIEEIVRRRLKQFES